MKTLPVNVYTDGDDCTNGGITSQHRDLYLACEAGWFDVPDDDPKLIRLVKRSFGFGEYIHAEPVNGRPCGCVGPMFGGNFVYTCDSRFPSPYPIPVHDRFETWEEYDMLSR